MGALLKRLSTTGLRKGLTGGSRAWMVVGVGATALRVFGRLAGSKPETVFVTELKPGEGLEIRTLRPDGRRSRG